MSTTTETDTATETETDVDAEEAVDELEFDAGGPDAVELDFGPTKISSGIATGAAVLGAISTGIFSGLALPFSLSGALFVGIGLYRENSRRWVSLGVMSIFLGVVAADLFGPPGLTPAVFVVSMTGAMVAWDVGQHAITIGEQFGRQAPTKRGELVHAAGSLIVGVLASALAYGVYVFGSGGQPTIAVALLFVGSVLLVWALRDE